MIRLDAKRSVSFCDGVSRRDFLHAGALAPLGLSLSHLFASQASAKEDGAKKDGDNRRFRAIANARSRRVTGPPPTNVTASCDWTITLFIPILFSIKARVCVYGHNQSFKLPLSVHGLAQD